MFTIRRSEFNYFTASFYRYVLSITPILFYQKVFRLLEADIKRVCRIRP